VHRTGLNFIIDAVACAGFVIKTTTACRGAIFCRDAEDMK
jgi:hypothetical protein